MPVLKRSLSAFCLLLISFAGWSQTMPTDKKATAETKNLYMNLQQLAKKGVMFGHQDDLAYGMGWAYEAGRSDVKEVTGEYPAVFGWDLGHLELQRTVNLDSVPFDKMREYVQQAYAMGGISTFSWHLNNPVDPAKTSWDQQDSTIQHLFADRRAMKRFKSWLDEVAIFMKSLKGPKGEAIPVIFRPWHEHNGSWFWWGSGHSSPEEYKQLYRFTVEYLRDKKKVHNLLYAYSPDKFYSTEEYLERYPGDEYVDLIGFDIYHRPDPEKEDTFVADTRKMVEMLKEIGQARNKVYAITEGGLEMIPHENWWTETVMPIIEDAGLSYILVWRNGRPDHYYAPYPGQVSEEDFMEFYRKDNTLFIKDVAAENIYTRPAVKN